MKYQKWAREADEIKARQEAAKVKEREAAKLKEKSAATEADKPPLKTIIVSPASRPQHPQDDEDDEDDIPGNKMRISDSPDLHAVPTQLDAYNGSVTDNYIWSQSLTDLDVKVPVPPGTKAKELTVDIQNQHLKVGLKKPHVKKNPSGRDWPQVFIDGQLLYKVKANESMWNMDGSTLQINLEKCEERMWKCIVEGEKGIDMTTLDVSRDLSEYDEESRAAFTKVIFDHNQKIRGQPTSEDQRMYDILKEAWDKEGSPFKGTPFDPSLVNVHTPSGSYYPPQPEEGEQEK